MVAHITSWNKYTRLRYLVNIFLDLYIQQKLTVLQIAWHCGLYVFGPQTRTKCLNPSEISYSSTLKRLVYSLFYFLINLSVNGEEVAGGATTPCCERWDDTTHHIYVLKVTVDGAVNDVNAVQCLNKPLGYAANHTLQHHTVRFINTERDLWDI